MPCFAPGHLPELSSIEAVDVLAATTNWALLTIGAASEANTGCNYSASASPGFISLTRTLHGIYDMLTLTPETTPM